MKLFAGLRRPFFLAVPCCALFVSMSQGFWSRLFHSDPTTENRVLKPGELTPGGFELAGERIVDYQLDVPDSSILLRIELACKETELELSLREGDTAEDEGPDFRVTTEAGSGKLAVSRFTEPPIAGGRYKVRVAWSAQSSARSVDKKLDRIAFTIRADLVGTRVDGALEAGVMTSGVLSPETGGFRTFKVEVPEGARALRLDIAEAESDLDLFAEHGHPVRKLSDDVLFAQHGYGRETLIVDEHSTPPLKSGAWYVDVVDILDDERSTAFKLLATFDAHAPRELLAIPKLAIPDPAAPDDAQHPARNVLARALAGVVEISTDDGAGSGTIVSSDGWIVTNAHVVEGLGGEVLKEVVIAVTLDPHRPSVEMFRARVESFDKVRDLALVHIASGFYGQPLPDGYALPTVEIGDPAELAIGDPLWLVGYPSTGGQGSRVTITSTRGVVSGFDSVAFGSVLKTDATITLGNSGGAALDAQGRLVGVPTSTVEVGSGHIGYVHPISALPPEWRARIAAPARSK